MSSTALAGNASTRFWKVLGLAAAGCSGLLAQVTAADATRGQQWLRDRGCIACHKVDGQGGHAARDLGRRVLWSDTPGLLVSAMWNHAPSMWVQPGGQMDGTLPITAEQAADLFAYFWSRRYFEPLGDAARGKRVFVGKHCAGCHGIGDRLSANVSPVADWRCLRDPIAFAQQMWNRPRMMLPAFARKGIRCPQLTTQELADLLLYLNSLPAVRGQQPQFHLASANTGRLLFQSKGCAGCHQGRRSIASRGSSRFTMAYFSAAMWNHAYDKVEGQRPLSYEEMCALVSYLWSVKAYGDPRLGQRLFDTKRCAGCHAGPPDAADGRMTLTAGARELAPVSMIMALWNHGPAMQAELHKKGLAWPRFAGSQTADMAAYWNARRSTVPAETTQGAAVGLDQVSRVMDYR